MLRQLARFIGFAVALLLTGPAVAQDAAGADEVVAVVPRDFPPHYSVDSAGNPTGFAIDVMDRLAARAGLRITYRVLDSWPEVSRVIEEGGADLVPNVGIAPDRMERYDFTAPVETFNVSVFVRATDHDITGAGSLGGRVVGVDSTNIANHLLQDRSAVRLQAFDSYRDALLPLLAGHIDAIAGPEPVIRMLARDAGIEDRIKVVGAPLIEVRRGVGVRKGNPALVRRLDRAIDGLVHSPDYHTVYVQWFGRPAPFWTAAKVALVMSAALTLLLFTMAGWRQRSLSRLNCYLTEEVKERTKAEEALSIAKEEAERANNAKSEFLSMMSHELRTPLNAIIGFSDIIANQALGPQEVDKYLAYAGDINAAGTHLLELINDILDLAKVEAGLEELHEEEIEVAAVAKTMTRLLRQRADDAGVRLQLQLPDDTPALRCDERKLKQILVNLLSNAVKFTPSGGTTTLAVSYPPEGGLVFQVADTGVGIATDDIPKAFEKFGQIDNQLTRHHAGTGLGLPLTKSLVELHGGSLDLQSEVGIGTTVTVHFPASCIVRPSERLEKAV